MLSRIHSVGVRGVEGYPVLVELDLANGLPGYTTVGLPDSAVKESRERVISAVRNSGYKFPPRRVTVNLAPGQSRKEGSHYDLPIALAVLCASEQLPSSGWPGRWCFVGELALDGSLRPVRGVVAMAAKAREEGFEAIVVPADNAAEAQAAGINVVACRTLKEAVEAVCGRLPYPSGPFRTLPFPSGAGAPPDLAEVKGQTMAKRALEIAAAGGHNLLFIGTPGVGKSMLARRLPGLLPPLAREEALELARVQSSIDPKAGFPSVRPFRAPHHTASAAALVGGGPAGRPGEVSLAHTGVLFLDELAEFPRPSLEALRQPLEEGRILVSRAKETLAYPARFSLVAATNPCPCGWRGHPTRECRCTPPAVTKYLGRLSGPLLDRIDLQVELGPLDFDTWARKPMTPVETTAQVRERVAAARLRQRERFPREELACNAWLDQEALREHCELDDAAMTTLERAGAAGHFSARSLDRVVRVARTIADLAGRERIAAGDVIEAARYRSVERLSRPI